MPWALANRGTAWRQGELLVLEDFAHWPEDVARLFAAASTQDFQSGASWFANFVATVELEPAKPKVYVWREEGQAVAALPVLVMPQARGAGHTVSSLGNYYTTRFAPVVAAAVDEDAVIEKLIAGVMHSESPVHSLKFTALAGGSATETALRRALRRAGCAVFGYHAFQNWMLPVRGDWPSYLAQRDGKLRTTLSRMGKRFAARGGRLTLVQGEAGLDQAIAAYERVYAASWKAAEPHPRFMPGLIRAAGRSGQLRLGLAWLGEQPVAAQVWIVAGERADIYKLAHDEAHKETSPGSLLTAMLMQHVFEQDRVKLVDYLSGDDAYKRLWMSELHERRGLIAFNRRSARGLAGAARESIGRLLRPLRRRAMAA